MSVVFEIPRVRPPTSCRWVFELPAIQRRIRVDAFRTGGIDDRGITQANFRPSETRRRA